ncbi:MAG: transposase [Salinibacterium sp.]|nr:transposase [Salinibacterium sp.]
MDHGVWRRLMAGLRGVPRWSPPRARYSNRDVLAVVLWSALHDRPLSWGCRRSSWPMQSWRRRLPDQSTLSRRLRHPRLGDDLRALIARLQRDMPVSDVLVVDGKAFALREHTSDPDATDGWGSGAYSRGYKLHALIDTVHRLLDFELRPMNEAESTTAKAMVERMHAVGAGTLLGDASYDSNPLHAACASRGLRLLAPRRRPDRPLCKNRRHEPGRLAAVVEIESGCPPSVMRERGSVERFFSRLAIATRLFALPPWARRLHRVTAWVAAKLAINAASISIKCQLDA